MKGGTNVKFSVIIDENREEEIIIYAKEKNELITEIKRLILNDSKINGYKEREIVPFSISETEFFYADDNKVYAVTAKDEIFVKYRLYELEQILPTNFIKINKSCIANLNAVSGFDASISGTLKVKFKSGKVDYVSRRNLKNIKERIGV